MTSFYILRNKGHMNLVDLSSEIIYPLDHWNSAKTILLIFSHTKDLPSDLNGYFQTIYQRLT